MNDSKRLRETHATELEGLLLASVHADSPSAAARARTIRAVALGVAAGSAAVGATGSAAAALPGGKAAWTVVVAKWLAIGAGAGVVVAGAAVGPLQSTLERLAPPSRSAAKNGEQVAPPSRDRIVAPRATTSALPDVAPGFATPPPAAAFGVGRGPSSERASPLPVVATNRVPDGPGAIAAAPPSSSSTLSDEVAYLDAASRALREHDPARAHSALDAYGARFRGGNLGPEATTLRAEAFLAQGDRTRAEQIAQVFLSQHPHSPHAARLRALLR